MPCGVASAASTAAITAVPTLPPMVRTTTLADVAEVLVREMAGISPDGGPPDSLLLLLRSSGDEHAERIRIGALRSIGERLASLAGWSPGAADPDQLLLRAQLVLAATLGVGVLRSTAGPQPLASATAAELAQPLRDLVATLLPAAD
jgi:Tetracyclin repressor-like, C-terminal domain